MKKPIREDIQTINQLEHDLENMLTYCLHVLENGDAATRQRLADKLPADLLWSLSIQCSVHRSVK